MKIVKAIVTSEKITVQDYICAVESPSCGATVSFSGNVRDVDNFKTVTSLSYEIHPSAQQVLTEVVEEVAGTFEVDNVAVAHRYGPIPIGESAFIVAVSAKHRAGAFLACSAIVDAVKARLPIWKHQVFADGSDEWVNIA